MNRVVLLFVALTVSISATAISIAQYAAAPVGDTVNLALYEDILKKMVDDRGMVAYAGLRQNPMFDRIVEQFASAKPAEMSSDEKLAFYLNAYNALVIKNVIDHYPIASPRDVDGFYKMMVFTVGGEWLTLEELEQKRILPLGGVYASFGVVNGTRSCPKLRRTVYTGRDVRTQLRQNADDFIRDQSKNRLARNENKLYISEIFRSMTAYLEKEGRILRDFIVLHLDDSDRKFLAENQVSIEYLPFNWTLNAQ